MSSRGTNKYPSFFKTCLPSLWEFVCISADPLDVSLCLFWCFERQFLKNCKYLTHRCTSHAEAGLLLWTCRGLVTAISLFIQATLGKLPSYLWAWISQKCGAEDSQSLRLHCCRLSLKLKHCKKAFMIPSWRNWQSELFAIKALISHL